MIHRIKVICERKDARPPWYTCELQTLTTPAGMDRLSESLARDGLYRDAGIYDRLAYVTNHNPTGKKYAWDAGGSCANEYIDLPNAAKRAYFAGKLPSLSIIENAARKAKGKPVYFYFLEY